MHEPVGSLLEGHTNLVSSVAFPSNDNNTIHQQPENIKKENTCLLNCVLSGTDKIPKAINNQGWICSMDGKLLLWVPDQFRAQVLDQSLQCISQNKQDKPIKINWNKLVHGESWTGICDENAT